MLIITFVTILLENKPLGLKMIQTQKYNQYSTDLLLNIFTPLSTVDLVNCSRVCSLWHSVIQQHKVLCRNQNDIVDDFGKLVENKVLNWNELVSYAPLSNLFTRVMETENIEFRIKRNNPGLKTNNFTYCMPKAFTRNGNYQFAIFNITDIEIYKSGDDEAVFFLKGEDKKMIACLEVEGDYLFALRNDGVIVQWDYKKQEEKLRIETLYAKKDPRVTAILGFFYGKNSFYVKNGSIYIRYRNTDLIEIIPYEKPEEAQLFESEKLIKADGEKRMIVSKDAIFELGIYEISSLNLLTKEKCSILRSSPNLIHDFAIYKNAIYAFDDACQLTAVDISSGQKKKFNFSYYHKNLRDLENIEVIGNLFFGLVNDQMHIFDLTSEEFLETIPFSVSFFHFGLNNIEKLVTLTKKYTKA